MFLKAGGGSERDFCRGIAGAEPAKIPNFPELLGAFSGYVYYNKILKVLLLPPPQKKSFETGCLW